MKSIFVLLTLPFILICCNLNNSDGWTQSQALMLEDKVYKQDACITYFFNTDIAFEDRESMISKCREYISDILNIIEESELRDSIHIIFVRDVEEMHKYTGRRIMGTIFHADGDGMNRIFCVNNENKCPIKHELMHMINRCKWGMMSGGLPLTWLSEGLAGYADPAFENDSCSYKEKYTFFLQNNKLIDINILVNDFPANLMAENYLQTRIQYNQVAYIVEYMLKNYGIDQIKELWRNGMENFEEIYGITFEDMIVNINMELNDKYPHPIHFEWEKFVQRATRYGE